MKQKKKWLIAVAVLAGCVLAACGIVLGVNEYFLDLSVPAQETIVLEYGEDYEDPIVTARYWGTLLNKEGTDVPVEVKGKVDAKTLGTYEVIYTAMHKKLETTAKRTVIVQDTTPPEIDLVADPEYFTSPIAEYVEEGYSAWDLHDGDLTDQVVRGSNREKVFYVVTDSSGNHTRTERVIVYKDVVPPTITLNGEAEVRVEINGTYEEPGFTATDDCDGDLTAAVTVEGSIDVSKFGDYTLTYRVEDSYGNVGKAERVVHVVDMTPPVITLQGRKTEYVKVGGSYSEPGYRAEDNQDGDLTGKVKVSGSVDTGKTGTYKMTYEVTDSSGNTAQVTRSIYVYQRQAVANTVNPGDKVVYLTFDDGPHKNTARLLDILDRYGVKATFFVTNQFPAYQNMIGEAHRRGHTIAIHTYSHDFSQIYKSEEAYFADLQKMHDICVAQTGVAPTIIRFPGGTGNTVSRKYCPGLMTTLATSVGYHGYLYSDWNVDSADAGGAKSADEVAQNVIAGIQNRNVSIVLQHDIKSFSVDAVEQILFWGIENGYTFLPMSSSTPMIHVKPRN